MESKRASELQEGGRHYKDMPIQPAEFCQRNRLNWCESNAVKYVVRHASKNGAQDIKKAIHYLNLLLEWEYPAHGKTAADYIDLSPSEAKSLADSIAPPSLCGACIRQGCPVDCAEHTTECGEYLPQGIGSEPAQSKQWTHDPEAVALSLSLPSITVEGDLEDVRDKLAEELEEWCATKEGTLEELVEAWDVIQVAQTYKERGGGHIARTLPNMEVYYQMYPERTIAAKRATLIKNAARFYYSPEVNEQIILSGGKNW